MMRTPNRRPGGRPPRSFGRDRDRDSRPAPKPLAHQMKDLIEALVVNLVDEKDSVEVTENVKQDRFFYQIKVASTDMGKLLGRAGKTISCIRTIVNAAASKANVEAVVDVVED